MYSIRSDLKLTKIQVQSPLWQAAGLAAIAVCAPLPVNAAAEPSDNTRMVEETAWRTIDAEPAVPKAVAVEIVAPIDDEKLGLIIYRMEGGDRIHVLRFGGPR